MELYVGLDVSLKETSICPVDRDGTIFEDGTVISEPEAIASYLASEAPITGRIGLESGPIGTGRTGPR
jgi:transposase